MGFFVFIIMKGVFIMRISPISVIQQRTNIRQSQKSDSATAFSNPAFKGWKAGLGSLLGAGAGIAIGTVLTGGILTPFIIGGVGAIGGGMAGSAKEASEEPDGNYTPDWHIRD